MSAPIRSPLPWMGGKYHLAQRILAAFPPAEAYDTYVEPCGGAAHVLVQKPPSSRHVEIYNDCNGDLYNFWMHLRDTPEALIAHLETLPYARSLYHDYHASLFDGSPLTPLERAVRWYYVLRSSFRATVDPTPNGWFHRYHRLHAQPGAAHSYHEALLLFSQVAQRFKYVQIDNRDFEPLIRECSKPRTLLYVDPPYVDAEHYYQGTFRLEDHQRLAALLNATPAYVVLSYSPHPLVEQLYPCSQWRRVIWKTAKHSQRTKEVHDTAEEMLLMNYPVTQGSLWHNDSRLEGGEGQ